MNTKQKYNRIDQSKLDDRQIEILKIISKKTNDFKTKDKDILEKIDLALDDIIRRLEEKNPDALKPISKRTSTKVVASKSTRTKTKRTQKPKATNTTSSTAKSSNNIMSVAKEIQKAGESWKDAMERAKQVLKERREGVVAKKKSELDKLYALVKTKKELQGFTKSDLRRDAVRTAKPRGSRVVTKEGSTSNQYGTFPNKLGRKYWETRDRHGDRLAPNYPKDMPLLAGGGAVNDAPFEVFVFKSKLRFDNELPSSSKGDFPTFAKAKEFAIDMIDSGNYYATIMNKRGNLWGVSSNGVESFANGGVAFKPYGKTKGKFKITYIADGKKQSEIRETLEMAIDTANRYKRYDEFSKIEVFDESGKKIMANGGSFAPNVSDGTAFMDNAYFANGGGNVNKWSYLKNNDEYVLVKGEKKVRLSYLKSRISFDDIYDLVEELNNVSNESYTVIFYLTKLGLSQDKNLFESVFVGYETENDEDDRFNVFDLELPIAQYIGNIKKFVKDYIIEQEDEYANGGSFAPNVSDGTAFMDNAYFADGGDVNEKFYHESRLLNHGFTKTLDSDGIRVYERKGYKITINQKDKTYTADIYGRPETHKIYDKKYPLGRFIDLEFGTKFANGGSFAPNVSDGTAFMDNAYFANGGDTDEKYDDVFVKIYNKYNDKNYFGEKEQISNMLRNWQSALDKGDKNAEKYTKEDVIRIVKENNISDSYNGTYLPLKNAVKNSDKNFLKSRIRYDQKFTKDLYEELTGNNLPNTNKEIQNYFDSKYANGGGIDGGMNNLTMQNVSFANGGSVNRFKFNVGDKAMVNTDINFLNKFYHYQLPPTFEMGYDFSKPVIITERFLNSKNKPFYELKTTNGYVVNGSLPQVLLSPVNSSDKYSDVKIKDWYTKTYPTDDLGEKLDEDATFEDVWTAVNKGANVYSVFGIGDSVIRERIFDELSKIYGVDYGFIYKKWLKSDDYANGGGIDGGMNNLTIQDVTFGNGGSVSNERMFNFLKDDLAELEEAIKSGNMEEVNRFFSYWLGSSGHLKSLETKTNERMYNFLKEDLEKLEIAVENNDTEEVERFFSYWGQHLESLKMANGGSLPYLTDPNFGDFQNTGAFANGGSIGDLTEQEFLKKYFGVNVFTENPSQYFEIKKMSSSNDEKINAFVKELKADGFTVKKRAYSDFTSVMGVKKKASFANGGLLVNNSTDLEEVAKYMFTSVKKRNWSLRDLIHYFNEDNGFDYRNSVKVWDDMNGYEMRKTYDNILEMLKRIVEANNKKFELGGSIQDNLKKRMAWADNKAKKSTDIYLVLQHKKDKNEIVGITKHNYLRGISDWKDWNVVYFTDKKSFADGGSLPYLTDPNFGNFQDPILENGGSLDSVEKKEIRTFVNSLFNKAKNKISNDKGHSLFVLSNTVIATKDSLGNPKFYLGVVKAQNSRPTYVVGSGFLSSDMLVYESYKKDSRFLETESLVDAKKFLTDKVKKQILHLKSKSNYAEGGSLPYLTDPNFGDFQNTGAFAHGGYFDKLEEVKFVFNVGEKIKIPQIGSKGKLELLDAEIIEQYPAEQNDGTYYPFYYVKGMWQNSGKMLYDEEKLLEYGNNPKNSFELGGAFVMTDLAGHTGGSDGLGNPMPLSGVSGTHYTGLVGETGAMSSGELFENGGGVGGKYSVGKFQTIRDWDSVVKPNGVRIYKDVDGYPLLKNGKVIKVYKTKKQALERAETYNKRNDNYEAGGVMAQNQQVINDASQPYVITEAFGNPAQQLGMLAKGGSIENQYEGRTPEDIWDNLTIKQKEHFLHDHFDIIQVVAENGGEKISHFGDLKGWAYRTYKALPFYIVNPFITHTKEGQYASGGNVEKWSYVKNNDEYVLVKGEKKVRLSYLKSRISFDDIYDLVKELNNVSNESYTVIFYLTKLGLSQDKNLFESVFVGYETENDEDDRFNVFDLELPIAQYIGNIKKFVKDYIIEQEDEYASGGSLGKALYVENSSWFVSNKYDEEKIMSVLQSIGAKNIRLENDRGWFNQPEVVVFNGDKNKAQDALNEAFDTVWIRVSEKDWRTKKMADGGFTPDVSDGTQFMSGVYAKGGGVQKRKKGDIGKSGTQYGYTLKEWDEMAEKKGLLVSPSQWWKSQKGTKYKDSFGRTVTVGNKEQDERQEMESYGYRIAIGLDLGSKKIPTSAKKYVEENNFSKYENGGFTPEVSDGTQFMSGVYADGGSVGDDFQEVIDLGSEQYYTRPYGIVESESNGEVELVAVATIKDLEDYMSEDELPEQGNFQLDITLVPTEQFISEEILESANDEDSSSISDDSVLNVVNYAGGLNYSPQERVFFETHQDALDYLMSDELKEQINRDSFSSDYIMYKQYNRLGQTNSEYLDYLMGVSDRFAKGGATTSNKKGSSDYTYVPNKDVKELSVVVKGELRELMGSDILDGVYVKNSAKGKSGASAETIFAKILKDAKEAKSGKAKRFDASELKILNLEMIQKLVEAGYTEQQIRNVIFGYTFDNEVLAEGEFDTQSGLFDYEESYIPKKIDSLVEAKKNNEFAVGIEYPDFDWQGIIKKYKISSKPKEIVIKRRAGSWGHTEYFYEVFVGENIVVGHNYGYKDFDADGKLEEDYIEKGKKVSDPTKQNAWQKERGQKAGFNGGYWYVVSSKIETIDDILKTLLSQKEGYCKELDFYDDSFPKNLKENKIAFADGGSFAPNVSDGTAFMDNAYFAKGGKLKKYIDHEDINYVTLIIKGKTTIVSGSDVLNGANLLEDGGDLSKIAFYVPKRDVVSVKLKNGETIKPVNGYWVKKDYEPVVAPTKTPKSGKVTSPNYPNVNFNHKVVINGKTVNLALSKSYVTGLNGSKEYEFIDVDGNPMTGYGFSVKEALKDIEYWQNNPMSNSQTTPAPAKIDESKAHFRMDLSGGKFEVFVDSNFVNQSQGNLPNSELKHLGFGEFYLETPDGNIDFIRTSEEKQGFVGRSHKMKGNDELVLKLVNAMKEKGRFEANQTFADGGSLMEVHNGTTFMDNAYFADGGQMQVNNIDAELEDFDLDNLDDFERMQYNHAIKSFNKVGALQILINTVEGDYSKLSPELAELAEMQISQEQWDEASREMYGYANGGEIKDIQKMKKTLIAKAKSRGLYENFGQKEVRVLEDKYGYTNNVREFDNWAMNFDLSQMAYGGSLMEVHNGTTFMDNAYFAGGGSITPALNNKVVERAEKIYSEMNGKTKADFDKAYDKAIVEFGYSPKNFKAIMKGIGAYEDDYFADGGGVDKFSKFQLNKSGNFSSTMNGKNYEIIYRDDKSQMYDLFENGKKIKSSKLVRDLMKSEMFANGGSTGSGFDPVKVKVVMAVGLDRAIEFYDAEYPIRPYQLLEKAVRKGFITLDEINERVVESAMETAQDSEDMEEIGSSDETYAMQEFLDEAGFKTVFVQGRLLRVYAHGGDVEERLVGTFYYDSRKDKAFRVISSDKDKISIQYFDKSKNPIGKIEDVQRSEFEYLTNMGAWAKYKQSYFADGGSFAPNVADGTQFMNGVYANGGEVGYDLDGNEYMIDKKNNSPFKDGDMAYNPFTDSVTVIYFNEDDEDADDEFYVNNNYYHVKPTKSNNFADGGDLSDVDLNFDFETEGDAELEYPQEVEKIKLLRQRISFDEVRGSVDYGKTKDNTDLKFYKKGELVMTLKGDYDTDSEILDTDVEILGSKHKINYHPYDGMGGVDYNALKSQLEKTVFAYGGFMNNVYAKGGVIKIGDNVRSTVFKGRQGEVLSKGNSKEIGKKYYFVRLDKRLPNGDYQHDIMWVDEVEKMADGGFMSDVYAKGGGVNYEFYDTYASLKNGFDLYKINGNEEEDVFVGNFKSIKEAEDAGKKLGLEKRPMWLRYANGGSFSPNVANGTSFMDNTYFADGGEIRRFDRHEQMDSQTREEILDIVSEPELRGALTNYLYGLYDGYDYSHTERFKEEMKNLKSKDLVLHDRINAIYKKIDKYKFEKYDDFADGGMFDDNDGFMKADNNRNFRYPEMEVYVETIDEPIDLTSNVSSRTNNVVVRPLDEEINLNEDGRIRAKMSYNPAGRTPEKMMAVNQRMIITDLPTPTSNTHKND